ncbi:MAG: hypothetical protein ACLUW6_08615 [Coriobacteriaceae bacterium]
MNARAQACRLCVEFPVPRPAPRALEVPAERRGAGMSVAVIARTPACRFRACAARCATAPARSSTGYHHRLPTPRGDDIHAVFAPQVVPDVCPGCGLCEQRCPVSDPAPAIVVVPTGADEETRGPSQWRGLASTRRRGDWRPEP